MTKRGLSPFHCLRATIAELLDGMKTTSGRRSIPDHREAKDGEALEAHVRHAGLVALPIRDLDERVGAVDAHDFAAWPDDLRDFESCLSKPAADVESFVALSNAEIGVRDVAVDRRVT